ncbi:MULTISPECIES: hypothetical protein [unclassified Sutcliffiella]|jgi:hypothetical protein|uniref:hypothetical protein n=1 Tax=unclassified Sutcliffiella TaxID=2837532 RepID=UPI0030CE296A
MGDIIPFRKRGCTLTDQELEEYYYIKQQIKQAKTLREFFYCRRIVKEFSAKMTARYGLDEKK